MQSGIGSPAHPSRRTGGDLDGRRGNSWVTLRRIVTSTSAPSRASGPALGVASGSRFVSEGIDDRHITAVVVIFSRSRLDRECSCLSCCVATSLPAEVAAGGEVAISKPKSKQDKCQRLLLRKIPRRGPLSYRKY